MSSSSKELVSLARSLPAQLSRFLARYPPAAVLSPTADGAEAPKTGYQLDRPNPFLFWKHPETKKWHDPVYSMRRQAELVKLAKEHGVEELLPDTTKQSEYRLAKRVEFGLRVKGTGVGQRVKGHIHERHMLAKMQKRREAMLQMPNLIKAWKRTGKKNWTKFPK